MSASRIPNLNTLRGGTRGRGRAAPSVCKTNDEVIQATDFDAAMSRISAVEAGYLDDPFAKLLTTERVQGRLPLMNRGMDMVVVCVSLTIAGTYVRTTGIDIIVDTFLSSYSGRKQVISLGAGSDTRFFRLKRKHHALDVIYHEIDFAANTKTKIDRIQTSSETISDLCGVEIDKAKTNEYNLESTDYHIHAQDLRTMSFSAEDVPTLVISECCLIYLSPDDADAVLEKFTNRFTTVAAVIYEPIRPNDAFGRTMVRNLTTRGIQLQTLEQYAELENQRQRLRKYGFESRAADIDSIWRMWIDKTEKERVDSLEWMDEVEEFVLLAKHYCISWGWKGFEDETQWHALKEQ
jgi:O-methyltransferase involved in polyketide biosynthesis